MSALKWAWTSDKGPQEDLFASPDVAIEAMRKRMDDQGLTLETMARLGIFLALVEVTITPKFILNPAKDTP